jgi:DNA mismatch repair ATPase MutS
VFHYTLASGPATTRTAIALLELFGAPGDVVQRSRAISDRLDAGDRTPRHRT